MLQAGDTKAAIDCCVLLHQWDQALQLAHEFNYPQAEGLLQQYAGHLLEKKKYLEAVELYRKVGVVSAAVMHTTGRLTSSIMLLGRLGLSRWHSRVIAMPTDKALHMFEDCNCSCFC